MKKQTLPVIILLSLIVGLTYLSYSTPIDSDLAEKEVNNTYSKIVIPTDAYIVRFEDEAISSVRTEDNVKEMFEKANQIWNPANLEFDLENLNTLTLEDSSIYYDTDRYNLRFINTEFHNPNRINVYFFRTIGSPNGRAFSNNVLVVADKTTVREFRTLAHEFGHELGLSHVSEPFRLMASGTNGFELTTEEITNARFSAERFVN